MESETLLAELETVLVNIGISLELRDLDDEEFTIKSGYCEVKNEGRLIIDKSYPPELKLKTILAFLKAQELDEVYISPNIREIIESEVA